MSDQPSRRDRRRFIRLALASVIVAPVAALITPRGAGAAAKPKLDPASKRAQELGYTHDAASSDNPKREADARCRNCAHFRGGADDAWAPCNIFPDARVSAEGWCEAWVRAG